MPTATLTRAALATAASIVAIAPLAACTSSQSAPATSQPDSAMTSPPSTSSAPSDYEDGTYNAIGEYGGAPSYLDVTLTMEGDVITAVSVEPQAENKTSLGYQERFAAAVTDEVVGKSLDTADVGKLAGASTCPDGFNDALAQIRNQAQSDS